MDTNGKTDTEERHADAGLAVPLFDLDSSDSPIYLQLVSIFKRQITSGTWAVGTRIPTIETLGTQFGVANGTVRQALAFLEREGLIRRMRRRGTFVIKRPSQPVQLTLPGSRAEMISLLQSLSLAPDTQGADTSAGAQQCFLRGDMPVLLEQTRIHDAGLADRLSAAGPESALLAYLQSEDTETVIEQKTTIGTADTDTAHQLNIPVNAAVALVNHRFIGRNGELVFESDWLLRGDLLNLVEHFAAH